ncbi:hypothetical protein BL253_18285 [Pseudofrankia asymbiotica]|uniref:Uncharacterized protein n=1 Tax=Pseudofrankia asymbiotica TaxID=1834516 RepID=A0A1V2I913_9ACTN|nr:hypothetical protein BL253_18285 [Pseudofrankia asymbiotica]
MALARRSLSRSRSRRWRRALPRIVSHDSPNRGCRRVARTITTAGTGPSERQAGATGDRRPATGDRRPATGDRRIMLWPPRRAAASACATAHT